MVCHDVVGTVKQEQIIGTYNTSIQYNQWGEGLGQCPSTDKSVGALAPMAAMLLKH